MYSSDFKFPFIYISNIKKFHREHYKAINCNFDNAPLSVHSHNVKIPFGRSYAPTNALSQIQRR